jgi:hypothetical protein
MRGSDFPKFPYEHFLCREVSYYADQAKCAKPFEQVSAVCFLDVTGRSNSGIWRFNSKSLPPDEDRAIRGSSQPGESRRYTFAAFW